MKRIIALVMALMLSTGAMAENGFDWTQYTDDDLKAFVEKYSVAVDEAKVELERRKDEKLTTYSSRYADFSVKPYMMDNFIMLLKIKWTNTTDKPTSYRLSLEAKAYQNDEKLSSALILFDPKPNINEKIKPGETTVSYVGFYLRDMSEITVTVGNPYVENQVDTFTYSITDFEHYEAQK